MDKVSYLINILEKAIPNLNTQILSDNLPETENQDDVLDWLYQSQYIENKMNWWAKYTINEVAFDNTTLASQPIVVNYSSFGSIKV